MKIPIPTSIVNTEAGTVTDMCLHRYTGRQHRVAGYPVSPVRVIPCLAEGLQAEYQTVSQRTGILQALGLTDNSEAK